MADHEYELSEPFDIDNGELDGLSPQVCFVLGVEWHMVRQQADGPAPFSRPIHARNRDRIAAMMERRGRQFKITYMHDDVSEQWMWLDVAPIDGTQGKDGDA